jgi:hypothetical protein
MENPLNKKDRAIRTAQKAKADKLEAEVIIPYTFWNGKFDKPIKKQFKISICTTCMNRLDDYKKSLMQNMKDNEDYPNLEFVLLDYNTTTDKIQEWVKEKMMPHIESGKFVYARTEDPQFYSMTHSRNLAFKIASGDIVNNVDADNYTKKGFATYLNSLANQHPEQAYFAKGKKMLRGRLGFYRKEFIELLGGYDEQIKDYGHDDHDLMNRAAGLGFTMLWFGGQFYANVGSKKHQTGNMAEKDWKWTEWRNKIISLENHRDKKFKANVGKEWGKAHIVKNLTEEIDL